jgi:hypothetical protein
LPEGDGARGRGGDRVTLLWSKGTTGRGGVREKEYFELFGGIHVVPVGIK